MPAPYSQYKDYWLIVETMLIVGPVLFVFLCENISLCSFLSLWENNFFLVSLWYFVPLCEVKELEGCKKASFIFFLYSFIFY
jgi:hypothetical protein